MKTKEEISKFAIAAAKKVVRPAKSSRPWEIDCDLEKDNQYIVWAETPNKDASDIASELSKHKDVHIVEKGNDKGDYDWGADMYNRDTSWVRFIVSAVKPK